MYHGQFKVRLCMQDSIQCSFLTSNNRFMVDASDHEKIDAAKNELHSLLDKPQLAGIPVRLCVCVCVCVRACVRACVCL